MKSKHARQIAAFLIPIFLVLPSAAAAPEKEWSISTEHIELRRGERILGFCLKLKSATVTSLPTIPSMWRISIYNFSVKDPPWHTTVDGHADVGLARLEPDFFKKSFVYIRKGAADVPFDAQLKILASSTSKTGYAIQREFLVPRGALVIVPKKLESSQ